MGRGGVHRRRMDMTPDGSRVRGRRHRRAARGHGDAFLAGAVVGVVGAGVILRCRPVGVHFRPVSVCCWGVGVCCWGVGVRRGGVARDGGPGLTCLGVMG